jgi:type II secretory pathway component PulM
LNRLAQALLDRTPRERAALAVLALVALPAALWLGLAEPLLARREAARTALAAAEDERAWLAARLAEAAALPAVDRTAPAGLAALDQRLTAADLGADSPEGARLADAGGEAVTLRLDAAPFGRLMAWLDGIEAEAGYRVTTLTLTPAAEPGRVDADLRLEPAR